MYFIYLKLREANINPKYSKIFMSINIFIALNFLSALFFGKYYPGRSNEIIYAVAFTCIIISILGFFAFLGVNILTGFNNKTFTMNKILISCSLTFIASVYCMAEAYFVTPKFTEIKTNKINSQKIRLVCMSDIHFGGLYTRWHFDRAMKIVNELKPDILILLGDTIDGDMTFRNYELKLLEDATKNSKYGAYAINGNHEYYHIYDQDVENIIRERGFKYLIDERDEIKSENIAVIGLDDKKSGWLRPYLKAGDENKFILILKHRPGLTHDANNNFDLQLSGHTHAGQFWPLRYLKNLEDHSAQGLSHKAGGLVYVSNGTGFNGPAMRLFAPPEISVIDLVKN